jgi:hypothetical protein
MPISVNIRFYMHPVTGDCLGRETAPVNLRTDVLNDNPATTFVCFHLSFSAVAYIAHYNLSFRVCKGIYRAGTLTCRTQFCYFLPQSLQLFPQQGRIALAGFFALYQE